jgi:hypothetical protein
MRIFVAASSTRRPNIPPTFCCPDGLLVAAITELDTASKYIWYG